MSESLLVGNKLNQSYHIKKAQNHIESWHFNSTEEFWSSVTYKPVFQIESLKNINCSLNPFPNDKF